MSRRRAEDPLDRLIVEDLASLGGPPPFAVDVRSRVLAEIGSQAAPERHEVSGWQIGWAALTVTAGFATLALLLWSGWPELRAGAGAALVLARTAGDVGWAVATTALTLLAVPWRLLGRLPEVWQTLAPQAASLRPFAVAGLALCYLMMTATILRIVGRDLRRPATAPRNEE